MKIIVLCTGNSCRSQIAEGLLKSKYPDYEIHSAGTKPEINVNPYAIRAMKDANIDISNNYPKLVDDLLIKSSIMYLQSVILQMKFVQRFTMQKIKYIILLRTQAKTHMNQMSMLWKYIIKLSKI